MGLITKPPSWKNCSNNFAALSATPNLNFPINVAGANNVDSTATALMAALAHDVEFLVITVVQGGTAAANAASLADILIDPAGGTSWATDPLIEDLIVGSANTIGAQNGGSKFYSFPLWIPAGASLGWRARTAHTATAGVRLGIYAYGGNRNPGSWWCGQRVTSIGINAAASQGTDHTGGDSGSFSAWADLGSPLSAPAGAVQFMVQGTNDDVTMNDAVYHFEFGYGDVMVGPQMLVMTATNEKSHHLPTGPIFAEIPSAAQLRVRATCSGTAEVLDVAAYAVH